MVEQLRLKGVYHFVLRDKHGKIKFECDLPNAITDEGLNMILDVMFHSISAVTWYLGLINNSGFTALAAADVMNSHSGWTEFTNYSESTRQAWGPGAASARATTNASGVTVTISADGVLKGIFLTSNSTKSGTSGKLFSTATFASNVTVHNGDTGTITYTVSG